MLDELHSKLAMYGAKQLCQVQSFLLQQTGAGERKTRCGLHSGPPYHRHAMHVGNLLNVGVGRNVVGTASVVRPTLIAHNYAFVRDSVLLSS